METQVVAKFTELLAAVVDALPAAQKPARVIALVPGTQVVWDDCEDGQLTGRLASMTPISSTNQRCQIDYWSATGELTLLRCALTQDEEGRAPLPGDLKVEAAESLRDTDLLLSIVASFEWVDSILSWNPLGPDGGCKGIAVTFTFKLDQPVVPPPPPPPGVVAGLPGYFTPTGAVLPADMAALIAAFPDPGTGWAPGEYVLLGDGTRAGWVVGAGGTGEWLVVPPAGPGGGRF
jgi:hypothetical protein